MQLYITTVIKGVNEYIKFSDEEQDNENFEAEFVDKVISKGKNTTSSIF